jgi:peptidoglycan/xylan/chitin deacetylase (PgdA/CDA1 family)
VAAGHAIGNHTWNHQYIKYKEDGAAREIDRTSSFIEELTGVKTSLFRPPGGILNNGLAAYAQKKNYTVVMWSADSLDWRSATQSLMDNVFRQASSGGIVLMHDGGGNRAKTVQALPNIIARLKKEGYKFVTVPELLQMQEEDLKKQETAKK